MHIYGERAHFAYLGWPEVDRLHAYFAVIALTWLILGRLRERDLMPIYGDRTHLAYLGWPEVARDFILFFRFAIIVAQ